MSEGEPSLKCVIAWSERRNLCSLVRDKLEEEMGADYVRGLSDEAFAVYGTSAPDEIRDWVVAGVLDPEESVLVFEFEKWSGHGPAVDAEWLMRRGH